MEPVLAAHNQNEWCRYMDERSGRMEYRFIRYAFVADALFKLGLVDNNLIVDVGAGYCDFDFYMRAVRGWKGRYLPVDGCIDGTDLEHGYGLYRPDFVVCLEVLEHLRNWDKLLEQMKAECGRGLVVTTPNTNKLGHQAVVDMDRTHVSPLYKRDLASRGLDVTMHSFFGEKDDSLLGVYTPRLGV